MSGICCASADHERWKYVDAWWRDQPLIGYTRDRHEGLVAWRNCRRCDSTLARHELVEVIMQDAPVGYWVSAAAYARLGAGAEDDNHLDLAKYFYGRALDAAVARFDEVCAAAVPQLVAVDAVPEQLERTEVIFAPSPWLEQEGARP